jgi:hypothetical protein
VRDLHVALLQKAKVNLQRPDGDGVEGTEQRMRQLNYTIIAAPFSLEE